MLQCVYWLLLEPHTYVRESVCKSVCKTFLSQVLLGRSEEHLAAPTLEVPCIWPQLRVCMCVRACVYTNVSILIGNGPFECIGAGMGSVCGRYFVHLSKMVILGSRKLLTMRTQSVLSLHQCHNLLGCFKRALAAK